MSRKRWLAGLVTVVALAALAAGGSVVAAASEGESAGNKLAGTWTVTVNRPAPLPPLTSLQVFTGDGSVVEMANEAQAGRTAAYGSWERINGRLYASTMVFFRFNPQTGAHIATQKINRTIELSRDGQAFVHVGQATIYDPSGNVVTTFPVSASGARMEVERIDAQP